MLNRCVITGVGSPVTVNVMGAIAVPTIKVGIVATAPNCGAMPVVTAKLIVTLSSGFTPLLAVIVALVALCATVGVPVIAPVVALICNPVGNPVADHVGVGLPVTENAVNGV